MTPLNKANDELREQFMDIFMASNNYEDGPKVFADRCMSLLNHRLTQFAEEIIGEDEPVKKRTSDDGVILYDLVTVGKNKLRAKQRATLKEYVKGAKDEEE